MSWATTKDAIRKAVIASLEFPPESKAVLWNTRATPFAGKLVTLNVLAQAQETPARVVKTLTGNKFDVSTSALVVFTVNVRCEHVNGDALELCELVRSGLELPSIRAALTRAGVAVVGNAASPIPVMGLTGSDQRDVSAYSFDAYFRHEVSRKDPVQLSTIERVEITGTANGAPTGAQTVARPT